MTPWTRLPAALSAALLSAAVAGCVAEAPRRAPPPVAAAPAGVEGEWMSTDGVAISRFSGGVFETVATDTGNRLADGSYFMSDPRNVQITVVSRIRQTTTSVNCALVSQTQLNCTSSAGQQFVLTRRGRA